MNAAPHATAVRNSYIDALTMALSWSFIDTVRLHLTSGTTMGATRSDTGPPLAGMRNLGLAARTPAAIKAASAYCEHREPGRT